MRNLSLRNVNKVSFFTPFSIYHLQKKISTNVCMFATVVLCMDILIDGHISSSCLKGIGSHSIGQVKARQCPLRPPEALGCPRMPPEA